MTQEEIEKELIDLRKDLTVLTQTLKGILVVLTLKFGDLDKVRAEAERKLDY